MMTKPSSGRKALLMPPQAPLTSGGSGDSTPFAAQTTIEVRLKGWASHAPMILSQSYLAITFLLFLVGKHASDVENMTLLVGFVATANTALFAGYHFQIKRYPTVLSVATNDWRSTGLARLGILVGCVYLAAFGIANLQEYGAENIGSIIESIANPGNAYFLKFQILEEQGLTQRVNTIIQVLVLTSAIYAAAVPLAMVYWKQLSIFIRSICILSIITYSSFFLYIGTLKGLADLLIFAFAGLLAAETGTWLGIRTTRSSIARSLVLPAILLCAFVGYMGVNQLDRVRTIGIQDQFSRSAEESVIVSLFGQNAGVGAELILSYPSHGYLGLAYNLETPFEWSFGLGSSRALNSYKVQYFGGENYFFSTYPARTEARTGWPSLMYWSTIYPWLASDLTFPGSVVFIFFTGMFLAKLWVEAAFYRSHISLILFSQMALMIAFIPANNQLMQSRSSLIGIITLLTLYLADKTRKWLPAFSISPRPPCGR